MDTTKRMRMVCPGLFCSHRWLTVYVLLFVILWGGLGLRLYGLDWDQGYGVHPDERYITWVASSVRLPDKLGDLFHPERSGLNPFMWPPDGRPAEERSRPFSYGHFPLYLLVLTAGGDSDEARLALAGRVLSVLFDTATIALTFALARLMWKAAVGVLAAAFVAFTVMHIQLAHFAAFDTALTCFATATVLFTARFTRSGKQSDAGAAGFCLGLAVGIKFSAILLTVPLFWAHVMRWNRPRSHRFIQTGPSYQRTRWLRAEGWWQCWRPGSAFGLLSLSLLVAFLAFGLTNPFSLIQPGEFVDNLRIQGAMLRGDDDFPFTIQYHNTWPYVYPIEQQLRWGMGVPLGLVAFGGLVYALLCVRRSAPKAEQWIPLVWVMVYFGFVGGLQVKFMRYMLPLLPILAIYGARLLQIDRRGVRPVGLWVKDSFDWRKRLNVLASSLVVVATGLYALAFLNVYRGDHPWVRLSDWIYAHIPAGTTIAYERWDHQLPLTFYQEDVVRWPGEFNALALDPFAPDSSDKLRTMLKQLAASDYLIIASNRLFGSTVRWPTRYPLMRRYYERLFAGQLGYQLVPLGNLERHPELGPVALVADPFAAAGLPAPMRLELRQPEQLTLRLGRADESFTVYDHPTPLLFRNVERLSFVEMESLFADVLAKANQ